VSRKEVRNISTRTLHTAGR